MQNVSRVIEMKWVLAVVLGRRNDSRRHVTDDGLDIDGVGKDRRK